MRGNYFIDKNGIMYSVERNHEQVATHKGLINREQSTNRRYISFHVGTDIQIKDWLISPSGDRYYVTDKETTTFAGQPHDLKCMIQTEEETKQNNNSKATNIFNIGSATGSVIGTQTNVTLNYNESIQNAKEQIAASDSPDKEDLQKIISLLEMVVNDQVTPQKGLFSKFSAVMERNSWITGSISAALLSWLTTQIH